MAYSNRINTQQSTKENEKSSTPFFNKAKAADAKNAVAPTFFQAKLSVGAPNDMHEKEADAVADKVVSRKADNIPVIQEKEISSIQRLATPKEDEKLGTNDERMKHDKDIQEKPEIQTMCAHCEEKKENEGTVQKKADGGGTASPQLSAKIQNSAGKGSKLPVNTLAEMNTSFGVDFSNVHVHTGNEAVQMNKELGAQAFTHGSDVYFNSGKYHPESASGKHLLAHELTHVVQQGKGVQKKMQMKPAASSMPYVPMSTVNKSVINNTVHCLKRWTPCSAPYSPGLWAATVSYHCPVWPGLPGTRQTSYVTIPDEYMGTGPRGGRLYRCRSKPMTYTLLTAADAMATAMNLNITYPDFQSCHEGYRSILRLLLQGAFAPSGGGPSGIRVNASLPVGGFPC